MSKAEFAPEATARLIEQGNRRALARAITLVESAHPVHRQQATALLALCERIDKPFASDCQERPVLANQPLLKALGCTWWKAVSRLPFWR